MDFFFEKIMAYVKKFLIFYLLLLHFHFRRTFAMMKKLSGLPFFAWCLLGCSTPPNQPPQNVLYYGIPQAPLSLDPATATDLIYYQIIFNIYETLIAVDWKTGAFIPILAKSWQADSSGARWTFRLRPGVLFHDGSPFTAEAVKISIGRQFDARSPYFRPDSTDTYGHFAFSMLQEVRALDDSTVQFILKYPFGGFLDNLATPNFAAIISPQALKFYGEQFNRHPSGTGPFQFERWEPDRQITIKKFQRYWGKLPQLDGVIYEIIPNLETKIEDLQGGNLHVISGLSAASASQLYYTQGIEVVETGLLSTVFLGFNCRAYPFSKVEARRAVAHALDKKSFVHSISRGLATIARGPLPPMTTGYDSTLSSQAYAPRLAKTLLQNSGYTSDFAVKLPYNTHTDTMRADPLVQAVKSYLGEIGLQVELVLYNDWQTYRQNVLVGGKGGLFRDAWLGYTRHPDNFLYPLFHSQSAHNFFKYKNPEVDSLLEQARRTPDEPTQRALYRRIQEIILQDVPAVFISHPKAVYAIRDRVKNFRVDPLAIPWLHEVRLE
jgi:peptide/nickel transport system substrate-binding protein